MKYEDYAYFRARFDTPTSKDSGFSRTKAYKKKGTEE